MQYTEIFLALKIEKKNQLKYVDILLIFARRGGSNEYPQSMFLTKNKENRYTPAYPRWDKRSIHGAITLLRKIS